MKTKQVVNGILFCLLFPLFIENVFAVRLLTHEKALEKMFPEVDKIISEVKILNQIELAAIKKKLGGKLIHFQKGSKSKEVQEQNEYTFYYGIKDGQKTGIAIIEEQPGKWGPVEYIIVLDIVTAKVKNMAVMSYKEKRGRPIARKNFLKQFFGKGSKDPIQVRNDVRAISGATISSDATCFAVKKVITLYEELVLKTDMAVIE